MKDILTGHRVSHGTGMQWMSDQIETLLVSLVSHPVSVDCYTEYHC